MDLVIQQLQQVTVYLSLSFSLSYTHTTLFLFPKYIYTFHHDLYSAYKVSHEFSFFILSTVFLFFIQSFLLICYTIPYLTLIPSHKDYPSTQQHNFSTYAFSLHEQYSIIAIHRAEC
ncbi:hypothetical protein HN873_041110 [Arachis hypogaea]